MTQPATSDGIALRSLVAGALPLLVAAAGFEGRAGELRAALDAAGLVRLDGFLGAELPRGARVGFVIAGGEVRLVDERDDALLRAPREGFAEDWLEAATRMRGTMFVVADGIDPRPETPVDELARVLHATAQDGGVIGAIVGVVEERPSLPLIL
jgi:hypothetical protein